MIESPVRAIAYPGVAGGVGFEGGPGFWACRADGTATTSTARRDAAAARHGTRKVVPGMYASSAKSGKNVVRV
jgi:hypothetical protein